MSKTIGETNKIIEEYFLYTSLFSVKLQQLYLKKNIWKEVFAAFLKRGKRQERLGASTVVMEPVNSMDSTLSILGSENRQSPEPIVDMIHLP